MLGSQQIFVPAAVFRCFSTPLVSQLLFAFVPAQVSCLVSSVAQCFRTSPRFCDSDGSDLQIERHEVDIEALCGRNMEKTRSVGRGRMGRRDLFWYLRGSRVRQRYERMVACG